MQAFLLLLFLSQILLLRLTTATTERGQAQNLRVRINAVGDTIIFKFIRPNEDTGLEGYILGYGSSMFSKQFIHLPEDGQPYETEIDAEPKYLIAVRSKNPEEPKKQCAGKVDLETPLNVVIGSVSQTSVLLSWGTLLTGPFMDSVLDDCFDEGQFTVRYREKEPSNNWKYQTCPSTSTVIDNLNPDALYEFEVRADTDNNSGAWSPPVIHKTADQIIEPFEELNEKPSVPVSINKTQSREAPLFKHTDLPKPWKTSAGPEHQQPACDNRPSSTEGPESFHTSEILPTPKTTSTVQPHPSTTQLDLHTEQHTSLSSHPPMTTQLVTTQQEISTTQPPPSSPNITTAKPQPHQTQQLTTRSVQEHPQPSMEQETIFQESQHTRQIQPSTKPHRLSSTQRSRGMSSHPPTHSYFLKNTTITQSQQPNTKPPQTTPNWSTNAHSQTNKAMPSPTTFNDMHYELVSQQTINPSIHEEFSKSRMPTTEGSPLTKGVQEFTSLPVYFPISLQPQSSTTTQPSSTSKQQTVTSIYSPKMYSQVENQTPTADKWLPGTPKIPKTTFTNSYTIKNSPVAEKVTVGSQPVQPLASSQPKDEQLLSRPTLTNEVANRSEGRGIFRSPSSVPRPLARNVTQRLKPHGRVPPVPPMKSFRPHHNSTLNRKRDKLNLNQVSESKEKERIIDLKQTDPLPDLKPLSPPATEKPANKESSSTMMPQSFFEGSRFDTGDNSSVFSPHPISEVDAAGKKRYIAPHVIYRTDKPPEEPCSVTNSLSFFPDEEVGYVNVTGPPKTSPSNLTVVTVEGCPSFVILDWDKTDNETTEYEVVSSTKGPHGEEVSVQTTNQTHTAVENLKPESSYEFKVTPKNELGSGPSSDPVSFSTESADPRVSEIPTGKNAIWSSFPFKSDSYSECNGVQFIKRTWYRKFVGIQLCNSLRYKIYLSDSLKGKFYSIGDQTGFGEDHCQFVDSFLDGRTGGPLPPDQLPPRQGFFRAMRQEPVKFGEIGGSSMINYVAWYECGIPIPGKW